MEFVAIDVETANADLASICQIGIAHFANGAVVSEWKSYVDPQDYFDGINISIHGIDEAMVAGAPTFAALAKTINSKLDGRIVVAHTAFDKTAIFQARTKSRAAAPSCTWLDSACVARRAWKQVSRSGYGLHNVCAMIGYHFQPHDALEDAKAAGNILLAAMEQTGLDVNAWLTRVRQSIDPTLEDPIRREGNPEGALYGEVLVFTGALTMPRREAADLAASVGCEVDAGVTKRTTILVVGDQDIQRLAGHEKSSKHRKAEALIGNGQSIRILRETDFSDLVKIVLGDGQCDSTAIHLGSFGTTSSRVTEKEPRADTLVALHPSIGAGLNTASRRIELLTESVKQMKRVKDFTGAERALLAECDRQEIEAASYEWGVAPWYYEQLVDRL